MVSFLLYMDKVLQDVIFVTLLWVDSSASLQDA